MKLKDKIALVTGGGTGIGKAVVEMLVREGAKVAISGIDSVSTDANQYESKNIGGFTAAKNLAAELKQKGYDATAFEADVTHSEQIEQMFARVIEIYDHLDILINAAGNIIQKFAGETTEDEWDSIIGTNLKGTFLMNKAVIAHMQERQFGRIVNFSSMAGKNTYAGLSAYAASKWGVLGFTGCLAKEVAHDNITVNAICPGIVGTQMWTSLSSTLSLLGVGETPEEAYENYVSSVIPQGEAQTTEDIAEGVLYLITAPHVTGIALSIDGGVTM